MDRAQVVLLITVVFAVLASFPVARQSRKKDAVHGGLLAGLFHHIGVGAYLAILPAALVGSIIVGPLEFGIPVALTSLAIAVLALLLYAIFEQPARVGLAASEDRGWTEQDARTSGL
ncbi:MAG: hypothetical protein JNJ61_16640 [Anaerolineae bacterium]|nr:hypothetical protein [Anaerolineae bacterium]